MKQGREVRVPLAPKRIVSLAPSITEILFGLGLDSEIAGVTDFCDYPKACLTKPKIGGFVNPSLEKIVSLKPDLIIGIRDGNREETIQRLRDLGLSVFRVDPNGYDGVMKTIRNLGEIAGREEGAGRIVSDDDEKERADPVAHPISPQTKRLLPGGRRSHGDSGKRNAYP